MASSDEAGGNHVGGWGQLRGRRKGPQAPSPGQAEPSRTWRSSKGCARGGIEPCCGNEKVWRRTCLSAKQLEAQTTWDIGIRQRTPGLNPEKVATRKAVLVALEASPRCCRTSRGGEFLSPKTGKRAQLRCWKSSCIV